MPYYNNGVGYPAVYQQMQNTQQLMIRVSGEAEAWNYPVAPGATVVFTDGVRIYIKTTDNSPTGGFRFERFVREEPQKPETPYITREEFDAFKASLIPKEARTGE